jgi:hypothetical protein
MSDSGGGVLAGSVEGDSLTKLLPGQAVLFDEAVISEGGLRMSAFLNGHFAPGHPKSGVYILNARDRLEAWNAPTLR